MIDPTSKLIEALEPFAREADRITPLSFEADRTVQIDDSCELWQCGSSEITQSKITYGDLRRAREALAKLSLTPKETPDDVSAGVAINGLNPKPGHADGCGAHDDYRCDCRQSPTPLAHSEERETIRANWEGDMHDKASAAALRYKLLAVALAEKLGVSPQWTEDEQLKKAAEIAGYDEAYATKLTTYYWKIANGSTLALRTPNPAVDELVEAAKPIADQAEQMERFSDQMMKNAHTLVAQISFDQIAALRAAIAKFRAGGK